MQQHGQGQFQGNGTSVRPHASSIIRVCVYIIPFRVPLGGCPQSTIAYTSWDDVFS